MNIGSAIEIIRKKKSMRQNQLAERAGITQSYLSLIESNKKEPNTKTLKIIASALDTPLPILLLYAIDKEDIPEHKRPAFNVIMPLIQGMIESQI